MVFFVREGTCVQQLKETLRFAPGEGPYYTAIKLGLGLMHCYTHPVQLVERKNHTLLTTLTYLCAGFSSSVYWSNRVGAKERKVSFTN